MLLTPTTSRSWFIPAMVPRSSVMDFSIGEFDGATFSEYGDLENFDFGYNFNVGRYPAYADSDYFKSSNTYLTEHVPGTFQPSSGSWDRNESRLETHFLSGSVIPIATNEKSIYISELSSPQTFPRITFNGHQGNIQPQKEVPDHLMAAQYFNPGFACLDYTNTPAEAFGALPLPTPFVRPDFQNPNPFHHMSNTAQAMAGNGVLSSAPPYSSSMTFHSQQIDNLSNIKDDEDFICPISSHGFLSGPSGIECTTSTTAVYSARKFLPPSSQPPLVSIKPRLPFDKTNASSRRTVSTHSKRAVRQASQEEAQLVTNMPKTKRIKSRKKGKACGLCAEQRVKVRRLCSCASILC
jgi:hypothetical protein